jgi:hypothetical protein
MVPLKIQKGCVIPSPRPWNVILFFLVSKHLLAAYVMVGRFSCDKGWKFSCAITARKITHSVYLQKVPVAIAQRMKQSRQLLMHAKDFLCGWDGCWYFISLRLSALSSCACVRKHLDFHL